MKEHALSIMLLAKAAKCTPPPPDGLGGSETSSVSLTTPSEELYFAFADILLQCGTIFPGALAHVMLTVIER